MVAENELIVAGSDGAILAAGDDLIAEAGRVADAYASAAAFTDYLERKSANTLVAQRTDLATWAQYLAAATNGVVVAGDALQMQPVAWAGVTYGLVVGFVKWMLAQGYSVGTINRKLSTVKVYVKLAGQAGVIKSDVVTLIRTITSYGAKEGKRVDEKRVEGGRATRKGNKKAQHVTLTGGQAAALKAQPDTPQGHRDAVIMCLLLDHGLRVGELALLQVDHFTLTTGTFTFYRPKVDKTQTHRLTMDAQRAVSVWLANDAGSSGVLLRKSKKNGELLDAGMTERAISQRVMTLGEAIGVQGLSAHDCRHYWASRAASQGTDAFALRDAGGWNSLAMPSRYVEAATIANERVKL